MDSFELRKSCNELIAGLKKSVSEKNIIKLSIDIQLPDKYSSSPSPMFKAIHTLSGYLAKILVNGLIHIEFRHRSFHEKNITLQVQITGQGLIRPNEAEQNQLEAFLKNPELKIEQKRNNDQISFEFAQTFQLFDSSMEGSDLPFNKKRILIAEDNEINAMVFSSFLDEWGCESTLAVNGAEAVSLVHDKAFDAILMDIHMPILNGNLATKKIREFSNVPIIALTASTQESDIREATDAGANDYLLKPVSSSHLFQVLSKYL